MRSLLIMATMTYLPGGPRDPADPRIDEVFWKTGVGRVRSHLLTAAGQEARASIPVLLSQEPLWELMGG